MKNRNRGLDVLRGSAILLVFLNHIDSHTIAGFIPPQGIAGFIYWRIKTFGASGVDLFFVLSGFLISGLLFKEIDETGGLRLGRFWARRAFKILPSYYFLLIVLAATGATGWLDLSSLGATAHSFFVHGLFFQNYLASTVNGPTWSLAVEEHFYLLLPLLLLLVRGSAAQIDSRRFLLMIVPLLLLPLAFRIQRALGGIQLDDFMQTHFRFDSLLFGVLTQWLLRTKSPVAAMVATHKRICAAISALLILPLLFYPRSHPFMFTIGFSMAAMGYAVLLLLVVSTAPGRWQESRPAAAVATIGIWSYNIYLWHFFLGETHILPFYGRTQRWIATHIPHAGLMVAVQFAFFAATSIGVGALLTQIVEKPFLSLRDRIPALAGKRKSARDMQVRLGLATP
jgi:peptidoglycan/LPS O-acetylase OafA/YrhL